MFIKKDVLNLRFRKFTGKDLCQSLFFEKVAGLMTATLLERNSGTGAFLSIWQNFLEQLFSEKTFGRLLLTFEL